MPWKLKNCFKLHLKAVWDNMTDTDNTYQNLKAYFGKRHFEKSDAVDLIQNGNYYDQCFDLALSNEQPVAWHTAWALSACQDNHPEKFRNYFPRIIRALPDMQKDGHIRELLKYFRHSKLEDFPENERGMLFDFCISVFEDSRKQPGLRSNALQVILIFVEDEPDLLGEVQAIFELSKNQLSHGVRKSCEHRINAIETRILNED